MDSPDSKIGWCVYVRGAAVHTYYRMRDEADEFNETFPGVQDQLAEAPWIPGIPGRFEKNLKTQSGLTFFTLAFLCQDCGDHDFRGFMVHDWLWEHVYPEDGHACLLCFERRLGRKVRLGDLTQAPLNWELRGQLVEPCLSSNPSS